MTDKDVAERSAHLAQQLCGFGLDARPYVKPPLATEIFTVNIETRQIRPWAGRANVTVSGDAKRRQAVVNVAERDREITRDLHVPRVDVSSDDLAEAQRSDIIRRFPVFVPNGQLVEYSVLSRRSSWCRIRATLRAPKTSFSLLMGFDEVRQFIAALPGRALTVEEAHRLLRPNVSRRARRQGEWFFDPATADERARIVAAQHRGAMAIVQALERGSSHRASVLRVGNDLFAIGTVIDGRVKHHKPLVLDDWHRVIRNAELEAPTAGAGRTMWD